MTLPMPGSRGPSGTVMPAIFGADPLEADRPATVPDGRPPWDELPRSAGLPSRLEVPRLQPDPPGRELVRQQEAPRDRPGRPGTAAPARHSPAHTAVHARAMAAGGLAVAGGAATMIGLFVPYDGATFWGTAQFWSGFAALCALIQLAPLTRPVFGWPAGRAWAIGAAGVAGLLLFWVLIVLPAVSSNSSFVLTAAVAAVAGGAWLAPGRRIWAASRARPAHRA
jgi:hypothetical protein